MKDILNFCVLLSLMISSPAFANWGSGVYMGSSCPYNMAPATQAFSPQDDVANMNGQLREKEDRLRRVNARLEELNHDLGRTLPGPCMTAIDLHYNHQGEKTRYQSHCGTGGNGQMLAVPDGFCVSRKGETINLWPEYLADEAGQLNARICTHPVGVRAPSRSSAERCEKNLRDYYAVRMEKSQLEIEIRSLQPGQAANADLTTEGGYCATCAAERRGYATSSTGAPVIQTVGAFAAIAAVLYSRHQMRRSPPAILPFQGYPQNPYRAPLPGYYNPGPNYGTVAGGLGSGAFGCDSSGLSAPAPWGNPYSPYFMSPQRQNPVLNYGWPPATVPLGGGISSLPPARPPMFGQIRPTPPLTAPVLGAQPYTVPNYTLGVGQTTAPAVLPYPTNFSNQMTGIQNSIQKINSGLYFGNAPLVLPYNY